MTRNEPGATEDHFLGVLGDFFNSWETSRGAFGFKIDGSGVGFVGPLAGLSALNLGVQEAFTDFAIRKPWIFQP